MPKIVNDDGSDIPDCTADTCALAQDAIEQYCKNAGLPPGAPVLVANAGTGEYCVCYCK